MRRSRSRSPRRRDDRRDDRRDHDRRDDRRDRDRDRDRRDRDRRSRERDRSREGDRPAEAAAPAEEGVDGKKARKKRQWDVDGAGKTVAPRDPALAAAAAAMQAQQLQMQQLQQQAMMNAVQQQQAAITRRARRLHVGNLPPGLAPDSLKELFDTTMRAAKLTVDDDPKGCVNGVHMAGDNRFCFLEFRSAFECSAATALDGMQLLGKPLRVARPNDYMPAPADLERTLIPKDVSDAVTSSNVPSNPNQSGGMMAGAMGGMGGMGGMGAMGAAMAASNPLAMAALAQPGLMGGGNPALTGLNSQLAQLQQQSKSMQMAAAVQSNPAALATMITSGGALAALSSLTAGPAAGGQLQHSNAMSLTRRARRLHVGNLPLGVGLTADMLKQFFNAAIVSANLHDLAKEGEPVLDCLLSGEGKFGFVEFRTIAEAISCTALNNIELGGKQLRIERPRDYQPMPEAMHEELKKLGILGNTSVAPDGKDLLSGDAPAAIAGPTPMLALGMSAPAPAPPSTPTVGGLVSIAPAAPAAPTGLPPLDTSAATVVLALQNMVTAEDQSKEDEMSDILEDTKSECEKHGAVRSQMGPIHRPRPEPATRGPAAASPFQRGPPCATDHATPTLRVRSMSSPFTPPLPSRPPSLQPKLTMLANAEWALRSRPTSHAPPRRRGTFTPRPAQPAAGLA